MVIILLYASETAATAVGIPPEASGTLPTAVGIAPEGSGGFPTAVAGRGYSSSTGSSISER